MKVPAAAGTRRASCRPRLPGAAMVGGELTVGHSYLPAPATWGEDPVSVGLLKSRLYAEGGRYRITKIYTERTGIRFARAPLALPAFKYPRATMLE